ncbi:MAG: AAA family ATPase [Dehalococcoidia bacterium]|nr:AAA family ATPase [Dehalococcoidia bacterium]
MLKRKIINRLAEWKAGPNKLALLIKGARQVGKTFIVREFGKANYKNFIEINFEKQPSARRAFDGDLDARTIILNLSTMGLGPLEPGHTLVFFDEIQSCPQARTAIKFLIEDGRFDYVESGSLLGINYREVSSYPVGFEEQLDMFPLDFEEFLWAKGITTTVLQELYESYIQAVPVDKFLHEQMMKAYSEYLIVGGMPSAVKTFIENDDFSQTLKMQRSILNSYRDDISKYADKEKVLAKKMFDAIPEQLNKKNKRFILADLEKGTTAKKYENASMWLTEAGIAYNCFNVSALEAPLSFNAKRNLYKLYMLDTGLLCAQGMPGIQNLLLSGNINVNEGGITENAVGAALAKKNLPLYYYDKKSRSELDFIFVENGGLAIIEVKSGKDYKQHASLNHIYEDAPGKISRRIVFCKYNVETGTSGVVYYPLYMAMFL